MASEKNGVAKRGRGRPLNSGPGQQVVHRLRWAFDEALSKLETRNKSLPDLLVEALEKDVNATVRSLAVLLPKDVEVRVSAGDTLAEGLAGVQAALARQKSEQAKVIDAEVIDAGPADDAKD